jgi:type VI protein secretion system component VasA
MKLGPGVDTNVPMFHAGGGLYVQRQADGAVRVMCTNGELPRSDGANLRHDVTLEAGGWKSAADFGAGTDDSTIP